MRFRLAILTTRAVNATSRRLGRGQGTVAGGRAGLKVDPRLLQHLSAGRHVALVTGTNGKTTTTRLLAVALGAGGAKVVSNETGSNMPPGHVAALAGDRQAARAVLEVDEIYLPRVLAATQPATVVLLNLSRDQLDRTNEVRMVAGQWRAALAAAPHATVVANADDPLVVWAAGAAAAVRWVGAGMRWQLDAVGCPSCEGRIAFDATGMWACLTGCGFVRPVPVATLTTAPPITGRRRPRPAGTGRADGRSEQISTAASRSLQPCQRADGGGGGRGHGHRYRRRRRWLPWPMSTRWRAASPPVSWEACRTRVMLAKNPAGWSEMLALVAADRVPVVVSINARIADGADPSWLWDVPFERLSPRVVVATGDRCRDLSVRLQYAGVAHVMEPDPPAAAVGGCWWRVTARVTAPDGDGHGSAAMARVDVIGNYTAFGELLGGSVTPRPVTMSPCVSRSSTPISWVPTATVATG